MDRHPWLNVSTPMLPSVHCPETNKKQKGKRKKQSFLFLFILLFVFFCLFLQFFFVFFDVFEFHNSQGCSQEGPSLVFKSKKTQKTKNARKRQKKDKIDFFLRFCKVSGVFWWFVLCFFGFNWGCGCFLFSALQFGICLRFCFRLNLWRLFLLVIWPKKVY